LYNTNEQTGVTYREIDQRSVFLPCPTEQETREMTIAIAGASGHFGRSTGDQLLERVEPSEVVLVTRDPAKLDSYAARGIAVRHGDFDDPASLSEAFAGVDRLLVISTDALGRRVGQHAAAFAAAKAAGVGLVAYTSIVNPTADNPAGAVVEHMGSEEALLSSGVDWTLLRCGIYADFQVPALQQAIASGQHVHNAGDGVIAYIARDDLAGAAAAVLSSDGHEGKAYDLTGPELQSHADLAAIASDVGGVPVEAVPVDDESFVAGLVEHAGLPEPIAQFLATFGRAIREGQLAVQSSTVQDLTGRAPRKLRDLLAAEA
jgi:NAD(P)H dehydrogenase (quinone)